VIQPPEFALASFVERLNITWQPHRPLVQALQNHPPDQRRLRLRVHLRNARIEWIPEQIELISRFLSKMPAESNDLDELLRFLTRLAPDLDEGVDLFDFLMGKKFICFQSLCKAEDYERKRQASNMETMMLQGARSAFGSIEQWRREMRQIDTISQTIFGQTQFFQQPVRSWEYR
jgi:hypothetical protein